MSKTQNSDEVFREKLDQLNDFEFNDKVGGVFDDMVSSSVPYYKFRRNHRKKIIMIQIGNFFFKYRNQLFIVLYLLLYLPSAPLFGEDHFGRKFYWIPIVLGLLVTVAGQLIRGATIGLAYIVREYPVHEEI